MKEYSFCSAYWCRLKRLHSEYSGWIKEKTKKRIEYEEWIKERLMSVLEYSVYSEWIKENTHDP